MLDKNDEKIIEKIVREAINVSVKPEFVTVNRKLDATMEMTAKNSEDITLLRDDFGDMSYTVERIETKLDATIRRQDDASVKNSQLSRRVLKLESKR